jgi:hypothetical protein
MGDAMKPRFLNPKGYYIRRHHTERTCLVFRKTIFEFEADADFPITYQDERGDLWRTDRHYLTDWGSIPVIVQPIICKDAYDGYLFHDSAYLHHGLWRWPFDSLEGFAFEPMRREDVDNLLYQMMLTQGAWQITAATVHGALTAFGGFAWGDDMRRSKAGSQSKRHA